LLEEISMSKSVMEVFTVCGAVVVALALGYSWLRKPKLVFMAWPAFGVAGAATGMLLNFRGSLSGPSA
jgi:hypothetical protein